jgi:hypothetical protein
LTKGLNEEKNYFKNQTKKTYGVIEASQKLEYYCSYQERAMPQ